MRIINEGDTLCLYLQSKDIVKTFGIKRLQKILKNHRIQEKSKNMVYWEFSRERYKNQKRALTLLCLPKTMLHGV